MVTNKSTLGEANNDDSADINNDSEDHMSFDEGSEGVNANESSHRHSIKSGKATPGGRIKQSQQH